MGTPCCARPDRRNSKPERIHGECTKDIIRRNSKPERIHGVCMKDIIRWTRNRGNKGTPKIKIVICSQRKTYF